MNAAEAIALDGRLDEDAWQRAEPITDFKQSDPHNGAPGTEPTEVRIIFDRDNLYIGAELFDSQPDGLLANQMVRDGQMTGDDLFMWTLDPFYDHRSGYFFEINPAGAMGDAQLIPAQGTHEVGTTQNRAWDGIWNVRVRRHDRGWTAEIQSPFRTLNFNPQSETWGANFQRDVQRKNEQLLWSGWGRNEGLFNLNFSGRIEGIHDVSQGRGLDIKPYLIGEYKDAVRNGGSSTYHGDGGLDFFYNLTPKLKTNFTINTDFAQTEVDDRQVNLTRFPLFFPEKRDFFLEGSGNFDFARERFNVLTAFFSRRIGLTDTGQPQKIDYGVKTTGQAGPFDIGFLQVRTAAENGAPGEDFTVFRPKRSFWTQSYYGLMYTRRSTRDSTIADRHMIGADFQLATTHFQGTHNLQFGAYFMKTPNGAKNVDDNGWGIRVDYPNDRWNFQINIKDFGKNLDPAVGFVDRVGYRKLTQLAGFGPRPKNSRLVRQINMQTRNEFTWDPQGRWLERTYNTTPFNLNMHSGDSVTITITPSYERLDTNFRVANGIILRAGNEYQFTRYGFGFTTANRRTVSGSGNVTVGTFYSGHRRDLAAGLNLRPRRGVLATFSTSFNRVELPEGSFSTKLLRAVINTQFSPFMSISNNLQYDSVSRVFGWQLRFRWIIKPGNDIYFVWLNNWLDIGDRWTTLDRSATTKIVYTYRF